MSSHYTIIQYLPDPVAGERINVGIAVFGDSKVATKFLMNWSRVERFAPENIAFLKEFSKRFNFPPTSQPDLGLGAGSGPPTEEELKKFIGKWSNSIQFTPPRASLRPPEKLLDDIVGRFLIEPEKIQRPHGRDKRHAVKSAVRSMQEALVNKLGESGRKLVKTKFPVEGKLDQHKLDLAVQNGKLITGAYGFSFQTSEHAVSEKIEMIAWALNDIRKAYSKLPLAVVVLPPRGRPKNYVRAKRIIDGLGVEFVRDSRVSAWANGLVSKVANSLPHSDSSQAALPQRRTR